MGMLGGWNPTHSIVYSPQGPWDELKGFSEDRNSRPMWKSNREEGAGNCATAEAETQEGVWHSLGYL